jgi:hypothetical protein
VIHVNSVSGAVWHLDVNGRAAALRTFSEPDLRAIVALHHRTVEALPVCGASLAGQLLKNPPHGGFVWESPDELLPPFRKVG